MHHYHLPRKLQFSLLTNLSKKWIRFADEDSLVSIEDSSVSPSIPEPLRIPDDYRERDLPPKPPSEIEDDLVCGRPRSVSAKVTPTEHLPMHWSRRLSTRGRLFYYNVLSNTTQWEEPQMEVTNDELIILKDRPQSPLGSLVAELPVPETPTEDWINWDQLLKPVFDSMALSQKIIGERRKRKYVESSARVISLVRRVLLASSCTDNEAMASSMKKTQRGVMQGLVSLIVAAREASRIWPAPDAPIIMASELDQLKKALLYYYQVANETGVQLKPLQRSLERPIVVDQTIPEVVHQVDKCLSSIISAIAWLKKSLSLRPPTSSMVGSPYKNLIIERTRLVVTEVGQLLSVMDELNIDTSLPLVSYEVSKQSVFNYISSLVSTTKFACEDPWAPADSLATVEIVAQSVETATKYLVIALKCMLDEWDEREMTNLRSQARNVGESDTISSGGSPTLKRTMARQLITEHTQESMDADDTSTATGLQARPINSAEVKTHLESDLQDLLLSGDGQVKCGTLEALVNRVTAHDTSDSTYTTAFLMTVSSFAEPEDLLHTLKKRFDLESPADLNEAQIAEWHAKKLMPIRLRVLNLVKMWVESYFDQTDRRILPDIEDFAGTTIQRHLPFAAEALSNVISKRRGTLSTRNLRHRASKDPMQQFLDLDALELARQLTSIEYEKFVCIAPDECIDKRWSGADSSSFSPNIKSMISLSNQITSWMATQILHDTDVKRRAQFLKHTINLAHKCLSLHNYSSVMAILAGLNCSPVHRLQRTWGLLSTKYKQMLQELRKVMDPRMNFSEYRRNLHSLSCPCVPFLGVYLTDLTFIEDGNQTWIDLEAEQLGHAGSYPAVRVVNFDKFARIASKIREIQTHQTYSYSIHPLPEVISWIEGRLAEHKDQDVEVLYSRSLELEPRLGSSTSAVNAIESKGDRSVTSSPRATPVLTSPLRDLGYESEPGLPNLCPNHQEQLCDSSACEEDKENTPTPQTKPVRRWSVSSTKKLEQAFARTLRVDPLPSPD